MHCKRGTTDFPNSYALLSGREDARTAVLFVHGFAGNAYSTWLDFQGMIDGREEEEYWKRVDLYFYDYQTTSANILVQADRLRKFLQSSFPRPDIDLFPHPLVASAVGLNGTLLPLTSGYDSLILVGHSLGGVIIRQAVLELASVFQGQLKF